MPRARAKPLFELAGQWIAAEPGKRNLFRYWTEPGTSRTRRETLGTADLGEAKLRFAAIVLQSGPKTPRSLLSAVLLPYFEEHTDKLPSAKQSRSAGRVMLKCWGDEIRVNELTEAKQKEFALWATAQGFGLPYVARVLTVLRAALTHGNVAAPDKIIATEAKMRARWSVKSSKAPRRPFIPTDDELVRILAADMPERLRRWIVISLLTNCRPEAALDLAPGSRRRDAGTLDLNPEGREQNKKVRPIVREPRALRAIFDRWERGGLAEYGGRFCGYTSVEGVKSALQRLRAEIGQPRLSLYSFRHKVTTVLRSRRVSEDQISMMLGHKRRDQRTTAGYGEFAPDYLKDAARALDSWFLALRRKRNSHHTPTTVSARTKAAA